jgi:uncharacterized protein DUF5610
MMNGIGNQFDLGAFFPKEKKHNDKHDVANTLFDRLKPLQNDLFSPSNNATIGSKLVFQSLSARFESFSSGSLKTDTPEKTKTDNVFDFKEVAKNVLDFVNSTLQSAKANGASDEKMANLFTQARSGVEQGFGDALNELTDLNMLDESLSQGITQSRDIIDQGINDLEQQLRSDAFASNTPSPVVGSEQTSNNMQIGVDYQSYAASSLSNNSDLSITTAEGDVITISFSGYRENSAAQQLSYASNSDAELFSFQSTQSSYQEVNFSFSVQGNLDDGEKKAIGDLIKDISKIEKSFFNGNIDKAFEKALKLGYDSSELSGFQLDLSQTKTSIISQKYSEVAQLDNNAAANNEIDKVVKPVKDFVSQFNELNNKALNLFGMEDKPFQQLLDSVFNAEFNQQKDLLDRLHNFVKVIE